MTKYIHFKKFLFLAIFFIVHCLIAYNAYFLAKDTAMGDGSECKMLVKPAYKFKRVPQSDLAKECNAVNRISADFAQVYFPARVASSEAYNSKTPDPWHRPSRYAPFLHDIYRHTLCKLQYGYASLLNIGIQVLVFYLSFIIAFRKLHIRNYLFPAILIANVCLFLTPSGLSWLERGQFSLFVASAYIWLFLGIIMRNPFYLVLSAILAYLKWTSLPLFFIVLALWILRAKDLKESFENFRFALIVPATFALIYALDLQTSNLFLKGLIAQETTVSPQGLSLLFLVPRPLVKALPVFLVAIGCSRLIKNRNIFVAMMPYLAAVGILSLLYPSMAFDYSTPCLLCFIPLMAYWAEIIKRDHNWQGESPTGTPVWLDKIRRVLPFLALSFFCAFLLVASSFSYIIRQFGLHPLSAIFLYVGCAAVLLIFSTHLPCKVFTCQKD